MIVTVSLPARAAGVSLFEEWMAALLLGSLEAGCDVNSGLEISGVLPCVMPLGLGVQIPSIVSTAYQCYCPE